MTATDWDSGEAIRGADNHSLRGQPGSGLVRGCGAAFQGRVQPDRVVTDCRASPQKTKEERAPGMRYPGVCRFVTAGRG